MNASSSTKLGGVMVILLLVKVAHCGLKMAKRNDEERSLAVGRAVAASVARNTCMVDTDCPGAETCQAGGCQAAPPAEIGMMCNDSIACKDGECLGISSMNIGFCSRKCHEGGPECPAGMRCASIGEGEKYCVLERLLPETAAPPDAGPAVKEKAPRRRPKASRH